MFSLESLEKMYKDVYYYKNFCKINIEYLKSELTKEPEESPKINTIIRNIELNKNGFFTLEHQDYSYVDGIKNREYIIGMINKNHFKTFKEYLQNRGDVYYNFRDFLDREEYTFNNLNKEDTDLVLEKSGYVWKILNYYDDNMDDIKEDYKTILNEHFYENIQNNYIVLFICNKKYNADISMQKLVLFLLEFSNYRMKKQFNL